MHANERAQRHSSFAVIILLRCNFNFVIRSFAIDVSSYIRTSLKIALSKQWKILYALVVEIVGSKNWISLRDPPFLTYFASKFVSCRINIVQKGFIVWNSRFRDFKLPFKYGFRSCVLRYARKKLKLFPLCTKNQDVSIVCVHNKE